LVHHRTKDSRNGSASVVDQLADGSRVTGLQYLGFRGLLRLVPERGLFGVIAHLFYPACRRVGAAGVFGAADVAQDRKEPWLHCRSAIAVEMFQCSEITFLHGVLGVRLVTEQVARKRVDVIQIGQGRVTETPRPVQIVG
jgi:hypothetical protein